MEREGLYVIVFAAMAASGTVTGLGGGVVVLETERLFGGDSMFYWFGDYRIQGNEITGQAKVVRHSTFPNFSPVTIFGDAPDQFEIVFTGQFVGHDIEALFARADMPNMPPSPVKLQYRERLP